MEKSLNMYAVVEKELPSSAVIVQYRQYLMSTKYLDVRVN